MIHFRGSSREQDESLTAQVTSSEVSRRRHAPDAITPRQKGQAHAEKQRQTRLRNGCVFQPERQVKIRFTVYMAASLRIPFRKLFSVKKAT